MTRVGLGSTAVAVVVLGCSRSGHEDTSGARPDADARSIVVTTEFGVAFPGVPGVPDRAVQSAAWGKSDVTTWRLRAASGASYQLQRMESDAPLNEQGDVDGAIKALEAQAHEAPQRVIDRRVPIGDCAGREFSATVSGLTLHSLLCVRASRAYMAQAVVPSSAPAAATEEADAFLRSFSVTK
jgi:hypothetical protein